MLDFKERYLKNRGAEPLLILDLGSLDVNGSYREYFDVSPWLYRGVDMIEGENVDIVLEDPYDWKKIRSNSVDVLISGQAFEHIEFFWITMLEIERVLRPGGLCCIIAPSGGTSTDTPWTAGGSMRMDSPRWAVSPDLKWQRSLPSGSRIPRYADLSNTWRDSVLICRKEAFRCFPHGDGGSCAAFCIRSQ